MSKTAIVVTALLCFGLNILSLVLAASSSDTALYASFVGGIGEIFGLISYIGAIRNAWWCKAYLWLLIVIFTGPLGALIYGLFGPGRLAVAAEQRLR